MKNQAKLIWPHKKIIWKERTKQRSSLKQNFLSLKATKWRLSRDRFRWSSDKVGKWWQWCLVTVVVPLPVCRKNLGGILIPVEKSNEMKAPISRGKNRHLLSDGVTLHHRAIRLSGQRTARCADPASECLVIYAKVLGQIPKGSRFRYSRPFFLPFQLVRSLSVVISGSCSVSALRC
jgi:hypothetical protein